MGWAEACIIYYLEVSLSFSTMEVFRASSFCLEKKKEKNMGLK